MSLIDDYTGTRWNMEIDFRKEVKGIKKKIVSTRRNLHKYPESGWVEYRTASIVAEELSMLGFEVIVGKEAVLSSSRMGVPNAEILSFHEQQALEEGAKVRWLDQMKGGHTAVIGLLKSNIPGPTVALRFDMDSNDLSESNKGEHRPVQEGFTSLHDGMMHACGHDGHTAIGLGVAGLLAAHKSELPGEVRLIFQPAEEGSRGAKSIVDAGWLDGVDVFYSGHIGIQSKKVGEIVAAVSGFLCTTKIDVTFTGVPAHAGAAPHTGKNALLAASAATLHLHSISRHGGGATRINVGTLKAGSGRNVIPNTAFMQIETRGETEELNSYMVTEAMRMIESAGRIYDVETNIEIVGKGIDAPSSQECIPLVKQEVDKMDQVTSFIPEVNLGGSEDATYMMRRVQEHGGTASYLLFGSELKAGHHQDTFDFDEEVLPIAVELLSRLTVASLLG